MDELVRLRRFSPAPPLSAETRSHALTALRAAIAGKPRRRLRPVVAALALVATAAIATGSYAVLHSVIAGSPAPPAVKERERLLNEIKGELIPRVVRGAPEIEFAKTKAVGSIVTSAGPVYLWVAPDTRGDNCVYEEIVADDLPGGRPNLSGGCVSSKRLVAGVEATSAKGHLLGFLHGYVPQQGARTLEIRFADGRTHSYEIFDRFVFAEVKPTDAVAKATVLDAHGRVLVQRTTKNPLSPLAQAAKMQARFRTTGPWQTVATLRPLGARGLLVEKTAPGTNGTVCTELVGGGGTGRGCGRPIAPTELDIGPTQIGRAPHGWFLLDGQVGSSVHSSGSASRTEPPWRSQSTRASSSTR